ncbi:HDOD domain-containing protein [Noviherbaspirillum malthae]|uniref:HDOD domain-containing protein n=1 Tax=Noviherbaspirillum malthae TaxID=1260987 RepID=UPI0018905477|nr:HDOD domain-containing protein [Noviherbaspirillum malthae]
MVFQNTVQGRSDPAAHGSQEDTALIARDRLLKKISAEADLPALGSSVSKVVQMTSSDDEAVRNLAHFILSDAALTQKILRIANTVSYRTASGATVTTVSKAIFLLGFEVVKTSALAMVLVEGMSSRHAKDVRTELNHALCASIVGREMAKRSQFKDPEEAAIASLFKNIGRLLVAAHDHKLYNDIAKLVESGKFTPAQASMQVLGCSFDLLGESVLREWNIPDSIVHALASPPSGVLKPAKARQEWLQQVAAFSSASARLIPAMNDPGQEAAGKAVLARFGQALNLDHAKLIQLFASVAEQTRTLASNAEMPMQSEEERGMTEPGSGSDDVPADDADAGLPGELLLQVLGDVPPLQAIQRHASGKPVNARDLLLAGVQDVTQMMASGRCKVNDLMLLVLETLYGSMGFRFATICLRDAQANQYRARISMGDRHAERQAGFSFPCASTRDLFHLAMENDADLMISDSSAPKIRNLLPDWHRRLLPDARSFIVLPMVVSKKQIGLFYADREQPAPEGVPADETALIKTLKGQILTALQVR